MYIPNSKLVQVLDKSILVKESNLIMATRLEIMQSEYQEKIKSGEITIDDPLEANLIINWCLPMVACSECLTGEMFTATELAHLPEMELDKLFNAVKEINPHWFPGFNVNGHKEDSIEKKTV